MAVPEWRPAPRTDSAIEAIEAELRLLREELEAWERFRKRLRDLSNPAGGTPPPASQVSATRNTPGSTAMQANADTGDRRRRAVQSAYEETVMQTSGAGHLEDEPAEHMAEELGPDVAVAVYGSGVDPPGLVASVTGAVASPVNARRRTVRRVEDERRMLVQHRDSLRATMDEFAQYDSVYPDVSYEGLLTYHERLDALRAQCTDVATARQEELHTEVPDASDRIAFREYLYRDCEFDLPVLATVVEAVRDIDRLQDAIWRDIVSVDDGYVTASR